jgi:hypothetical protein
MVVIYEKKMERVYCVDKMLYVAVRIVNMRL